MRNATSRHDLAARGAARLQLLGFGRAAQPDNDDLYPTDDLRCVAQIRFSPAGRTAARTLSLVAPCAQLVRDDSRDDSAVHLVLGTEFTALDPTRTVRDLISALHPANAQTDQRGGLQSLTGTDTPEPVSVPLDIRSC